MSFEMANAHAPENADVVNSVTVSVALSLWTTWNLHLPPTGSTGDATSDQRLAAAFRVLASLPDLNSRLRWIESELFTGNDFPPPDQPVDRYRVTLTKWGLDLYESEKSGLPAPQ